MKTRLVLLSLFLAFLTAGKASAQQSILIFSEKGEKFTLSVNGSQRNDKPASLVDTDRPGGPTFKLLIRFEDNTIPDLTKTVFNSPGAAMYYVIRKTDKGKFILDKTNSESVPQKEPAAVKEDPTVKKEDKPKTEEPESEAKPAGGNGKGCPNPMNEADFQVSRAMISNAPFDGPRLSQAKKLADAHCLTTTQIIEVIYVFSGDSPCLNFAKYAYQHCNDPANYDRVKDVLRKSSQGELQKYIESVK
jgi:hypothetical protein